MLGMSEYDFWHSTPAKLYELALVHVRMNSPKKEESSNKSGMTWYKVLD